jgi:hypothetical protein
VTTTFESGGEGVAESNRRVLVQQPLPPMTKGEVWNDHGQGEVGSLRAKRFDMGDGRRDHGAVGRLDEIERHLIAPGGPVPAEALRLLLGRAYVERQHGLTQRGCVGEGSHAHAVEMRDRDDREVRDLCGRLLALAIPRSRDAERDGAGDAVEVAAGEG